MRHSPPKSNQSICSAGELIMQWVQSFLVVFFSSYSVHTTQSICIYLQYLTVSCDLLHLLTLSLSLFLYLFASCLKNSFSQIKLNLPSQCDVRKMLDFEFWLEMKIGLTSKPNFALTWIPMLDRSWILVGNQRSYFRRNPTLPWHQPPTLDRCWILVGNENWVEVTTHCWLNINLKYWTVIEIQNPISVKTQRWLDVNLQCLTEVELWLAMKTWMTSNPINKWEVRAWTKEHDQF